MPPILSCILGIKYNIFINQKRTRKLRKQLKEALGLITRAQDILNKVSSNDKIPEPIRKKSRNISKALDVDLEELEKMRSH